MKFRSLQYFLFLNLFLCTLVALLSAHGNSYAVPLAGGAPRHVDCHAGERGPSGQFELELTRAFAATAHRRRRLSAAEGKLRDRTKPKRCGKLRITLKWRRQHLLVTGVGASGNGGRWRGTASGEDDHGEVIDHGRVRGRHEQMRNLTLDA
jgi:hypothetical protein